MMKLVLLSMFAAILSGCSSLTPSPPEQLIVGCDAPRPIIEINGQLFETDKVTVELEPKNPMTVGCHADGFYSVTLLIDTKYNAVGSLDPVGGFLLILPILGIEQNLEQKPASNEIYLSLEPITHERRSTQPISNDQQQI